MEGSGPRLSDEGHKIYRIRQTCMKMLEKRGYNVLQEHVSMTSEAFLQQYGPEPNRHDLTLLVEKVDDPMDQIFVFFPDDEKVGVKPIRSYSEKMLEEEVKRAIIVIKGGITPFARSAIQELCAQREVQVEDFKDAELMLDITEHTLVPEHQVLSSEQKAELLKRYKLKDTQLPRIQSTDPVARFFGMQKGQVCKITRPSETAGRYVTYRLCI
ncbi:unnamed protein product [Ectocarpus sp. 6 AP-2014]|uniref:Uncharacterized protein n=1 Tax=Ectocarpus siliculosus TaxID=2880 RepID=D7G1Y9_ECTSI|nr:unnamed protein product [Ectocarpus sp. CCAP 1310/34]CBJ48715.1 conserved unknown protein [Ectocarpus siliculosus]|eukprot:CBJ48715.1 conserved unknown protein [Ectocarpus siliculosus]